MSISITLTGDDANAWIERNSRPVNSNPTSSAPANRTGGTAGGSASANADVADPWTDDAPQNTAASNSGPPTRNCKHGAMRYVPNGQYGPFFGCPLNRDDPDKCKTQKA